MKIGLETVDNKTARSRFAIVDKELNGKIVRIDDAYPTPHPINKLSLYGNSKQSTTTGANKFDPAEIKNGSANGLTWKKNENGSITINGTATALTNINLVIDASNLVLSVGQWTASVKGAYKSKLVVQTLDGKHYVCTNSTATINNVTKQGLKYFLIQVQAQTTINETVFVYLEKSDKALYEEYTDGKPTPRPDSQREITNVKSVDVTVAGKNLVEEIKVDSHTARFATVLKLKMELFPSTQYCLSFEDVKDNQYYLNETLFEYQRIIATGSRQFLLVKTKDVLDKSDRLQFDSINGCWIVLKNDKEQSNAPQFKDVQFEFGSDNTPYEAPSKLITLPIGLQGHELCSLPNGVQDEMRIGKDGNVELVRRLKKVVMDGSADEDWRQNGSTDTHVRFYTVFEDKAFGTPRMEHVISDRFSLKNKELAERETLRLVEIGLPKSIIPTLDVSLLREWLAKNPTTFIYKLDAPEIIALGRLENPPTLNNMSQTVWANTNVPTTVGINYKSYSIQQEDTMAEKKYLDLTGLTGYDAKIKALIDSKDAATLKSAKDYSDGLAKNYDAAGSAATALNDAKAHTNGEITKVNAAVAAAKTQADKGVTDAAAAKAAADKAQGEVDALELYVGTVPVEAQCKDVIAYIDKKTSGIATDTALSELQQKVATNTSDIATVKGDYLKAADRTALEASIKVTDDKVGVLNGTGAGSVKKTVDDAINEFATKVSNDKVVNTYKELVDYAAAHAGEAATMAGNISKNTDAINGVKTLVGTIPVEATSATVIEYVDEKVVKETSRATGVENGLDTRLKAVEGKFSGTGAGSVADDIAKAKQAAIDAAAADATTKANNAKTGAVADAKSYTDTEVGKVKSTADANATAISGINTKIDTLEGKAHTHANAAVLDGIDAGKVSKWDGAATNSHTHANKAVLDGISSAKVSAWDAAETNAKKYADTKIAEFVAITPQEIEALFAVAPSA